MAPMHVNHAREVPEYEINPKELDFTNSVEITKVNTSIGIIIFPSDRQFSLSSHYFISHLFYYQPFGWQHKLLNLCDFLFFPFQLSY